MNLKRLGGVLVPVLIVVAPLAIPLFSVSFNSGDILAPTTFIFSVLAGFFIADATANYRSLRKLILDENAALSQIYYITQRENLNEANKLAEAIDKYMVAQLDYNLLDHFENTKNEFGKIVEISKNFPSLDRILTGLIAGNHEIYLSARKTISNDRWFLLIALAMVIVYILLTKRTGDPVLSILIGIVLASVQQALKLLHDLDVNKYLADQLGYKTPQEVFRAIGKIPYYPEIAVSSGWIKPTKKPYRLGVYKNYPHSFEKTIKTIE